MKTNTQQAVGNVNRSVAQETIMNVQEAFKKQLIDMGMQKYGFSYKQSEMIFNRAWDDGHSCGLHEVSICFEDLADFMQEFMQA